MAGRKGGDGDMVLGGRHLIGIFALLVVILGVVFTLGYLLGRSQYDAALNPSVEAAIRRVDKLTGKSEKPEKAVPASHPAPTDDSAKTAANHPTDFDFYHSGEEEKNPERLEAPPKPVASKPKPAVVPAESAELKAVEPKAVEPKASVRPPIPAKSPVTPGTKPPTAVKAEVPAKAPVLAAKNNGSSRPAALNTPQIPKGATVLQVAALVREADALAMAQALQQKKFPAFVLTPGDDHFYRVQVGPYGDPQSANAARQALENQGFKSILKR
jgi:cell division septation protein DedD